MSVFFQLLIFCLFTFQSYSDDIPLYQWGLEYTDCILVEGISPHLHKKDGVLGMILNSIWLKGFSLGDIVKVGLPFITPRATLIWNGSTCLSHIYRANRSAKKLYLFNRNTGYHITEYKNTHKKTTQKNLHIVLFNLVWFGFMAYQSLWVI